MVFQIENTHAEKLAMMFISLEFCEDLFVARARNIKPSFFTNEYLVELEPIYRLMFVGLWTLADREGRIENRPKKIKMELFPADNIDIAQGLKDLEKTGFIQLYNCYETDVIQINNFTKHQSPHGLEKDSDLPDTKGFYTVYPRENKNPKNKCVSGDGVLYSRTDYLKLKGIEENQSLEVNHDNNSYETVIAPSNNALNPECGILNPDSLNPVCEKPPAQKTEESNFWNPNKQNLEAILRTTKHSQKVNEILGMEDFEFHLGNFNTHHEKNFQLTDNQKHRKFAQWLIQEYEKQVVKNEREAKKVTGYQTAAQKTEAEMDKWKNFTQSSSYGSEPIDITPEQQIFIKG